MAAAAMLASAREATGISQRELASRCSTAQSAVSFVESGDRIPTSDTLERLLAATRHRLISIPSVRFDSSATAERIRSAVAAGRHRAAFRAFLDFADALALEEPATRVALAVSRPRMTGSPEWDAALAAIVHLRLGRAALPIPRWVDEAARTLPTPSAPDLGIAGLEIDPREVAEEFLQRNVLIQERSLSSV